MTPLKQKRLIAVLALGLAGGALAYISFGNLEKNLVYYWDVPELLKQKELAQQATIRLGGLVQQGSIQWDAQTLQLAFQVGSQPLGGPTIAVKSHGAPPQMFQESMGVVIEGRYDGAVFNADRVMVKHSNEYRAPKDGEKPQEIYKTLLEKD